MVYIDDDEHVSLTDNSIRKRRRNKLFEGILIIAILVLIYITTLITSKKFLYNGENIIASKKTNLYMKKHEVDGFLPLYTDNRKGPITVDREQDDGSKINIYEKILDIPDNKLENFYYDPIKEQDKIINMDDEYFCEDNNVGRRIYCPFNYHVIIDDAFYGRHARDNEHCVTNHSGERLPDKDLLKFGNMFKDCGEHFKEKVQNLCEGSECTFFSGKYYFPDTCSNIYKYLHVKYHCEKDEEIKKPNFAVVMFANIIKPNSIYENSISEFYQYADVHGYEFFFYNKRYDTQTNLFYMKLHALIETIVVGLKTKKFDWIFWVDSDTVLTNPNIKLETFIPLDNNIHFIAAADKNGLNAGIFLIRVHSWSLNFLMQSISYQHYYPKEKLEFSDQTSMNNVLCRGEEDEHYVIVPQQWFNKYHHYRKNGDFLLHFAGRKDKNGEAKDVREEVYNNPDWLKGLTNKQMREEVIKYYNLPRDKQEKNGKFKLDDRLYK